MHANVKGESVDNGQEAGSRLIKGNIEMFHTVKPPEGPSCSQSPLQPCSPDSVFVGH